MNDASPAIDFAERRRRFLEEKARQSGVPTPPQQDVPDLGQDSRPDSEIDEILDRVGIVEAYTRWCGKKLDERTLGKREGVKISCPKPDHPDNDPSAWLNLDNDLWFCGGCQEGGDKYDIAAYHFGFPVPGYKDGKSFHELRERMAEDLGYRIKKVPGGTVVYQEADENRVSRPDTSKPVQSTQIGQSSQSATPAADEDSVATVTELHPEDEPETPILYPKIDWQAIVPEDTFLREYLEACTNDDSPEEYHFWHGLLGIAHALGRNVTLDDTRPVYSNLLICLLGGTGVGKSRSKGWLDKVLTEVMPYRDLGTGTTGVKIISEPASGEYLIKAFSYEARDPANPKVLLGYQPVNGIVDFDELSSLLARANRQGSTLKPIIQQFADTRDTVRTASLTRGEFRADKPFCSFTSSTQPRAIRSLLNKTDTGSGFLNRWIFAGGPVKRREVLGGQRSKISIDLSEATEKLKKIYTWAGKERKVTLSDEAFAEMEKFFQETIFPVQARDDTDLLKRLDLLFKKIILLFAANEKLIEVPKYIVERAETLFQYVVDCYALLHENIGITLVHEVADDILRVAKRIQELHGRAMTPRDLQRSLHRKRYPPNMVRQTLDNLVALDLLELEKPKRGSVGRPTVRYKVVE